MAMKYKKDNKPKKKYKLEKRNSNILRIVYYISDLDRLAFFGTL